VFHDPVRHGVGWVHGAIGTGVSGVVMLRDTTAKVMSEGRSAPPALREEDHDGGMVKTSSDEHQSAERVATLAPLAS
jgi:hypothetical protein